jgi:hypothetical protein
MARKLNSEEAQAFNDAVDAGRIPVDAKTFLRSLIERQTESPETPLISGTLEQGSLPEPFGS